MSVFESVEAIQSRLSGQKITPQEREILNDRFQSIKGIEWVGDLMSCYALSGTTFTLDEEVDPSGLGVEMQWMAPADMVEEAFELYPGIPALGLGYLPIGQCLSGSGDPYFLKIKAGEDPPLVRIPHESAEDENTLDESQIEEIVSSLSAFLGMAKIE